MNGRAQMTSASGDPAILAAWSGGAPDPSDAPPEALLQKTYLLFGALAALASCAFFSFLLAS